MPQENKFRAWDPNLSRMIPWESMQCWTMASLENDNMMQFTGLKDKNGKDIYEGDIVKGIWPVNNIVEVKSTEIASGFTPFNDDYCFGGKDVEVIGNIYVNPELLK